MTFVVADACVCCKYTDCVKVCPVGAIYRDWQVPEDQRAYIRINAELSRRWPGITAAKPACPDADIWAGRRDKRYLIKP